MAKKLGLALLMLFLMPALACAGWIFPSVITGAASGSISPATQVKAAAAKTFTLTPASGNTVNYATVDNGNTKLPLTSIGSNQWTVTVPLNAANQNLYVYFKAIAASQPLALVANAGPTPKSTPVATPLGLSGGNSTVSFLPPGVNATYEWSASPGTGVTFSSPTGIANTPSNIYTTFTAATAGSYNVTLKLTAGSTTSSATISIMAQPANVAASTSCIGCHNTQGASYSSSRHAFSNNGPACQNCHNPTGTGIHPFAVVTSAICESCHAATLSTTTHPADITASKCLGCHDSHDPAEGIANLGPAPAHPAVTLYTFEEIGMQMAGGAKVPVQVDANGKGMPYSPKQTCGTAGCHVKNGVDYTYDKISDHAFHSSQGRPEYVDSPDGKFDATKSKPWGQSTAMVGKW